MFKKAIYKIHNNIQGQAIAETAVCLIPIILIFCFTIFFCVINRESLKALLVSQEKLVMEQYNKSPHHVEYVSTGEDELNFTQDDRQNAGYAGDSEFFTAELYTDQSSDTRGYSFNASPEQNGSNIHSHEYVLSDQFENLNTLIFLNAANLLGVRTRTCISCTNNEIKGVMNVLNNLINIEENYRFDETLFRPLDPEDQTTL